MMAVDKYGRQRKLCDGEALQDGERLRVGLTFMDSAQRAVAKLSERPEWSPTHLVKATSTL
jgi:hypothetical protein